jgi:ribosomal RNA-processing protein 8
VEARRLQRAGLEAVAAKPAPAAPAAAAPKGKAAKPSVLQRAQAQLAGGRFRWLNEELYSRDGGAALALMGGQPELFAEYHAGFRSQTAGWPRQPLDVCIAWLRRCPVDWAVADIGCGDARLAAAVPQRVLSFDLVATAPGVTACDMCALPVGDGELDAAVFCLSLMGTDYGRALGEARRALRPSGALWVAEVRSRFAGAEGGARAFLNALGALGFTLKETDESDTMFVVYRLIRTAAPPGRPDWPLLKVCQYKKR